MGEDDFESHVRIGEGYRAFSAELLRLSLLAISAIAYLWLRVKLPEKSGGTTLHINMCLLIAAFTLFCCTAMSALVHMYLANDSLAEMLRYRAFQKTGADKADDQRLVMIDKLKQCGWALALGSATLVVGVICLMVAVFLVP